MPPAGAASASRRGPNGGVRTEYHVCRPNTTLHFNGLANEDNSIMQVASATLCGNYRVGSSHVLVRGLNVISGMFNDNYAVLHLAPKAGKADWSIPAKA